MSYLEYLAKMGKDAIHPGGISATQKMIGLMNLNSGDLVLEIGCGTGGTIVQILGQHALRLVAIDVLRPMLRMAKRRAKFCGLLSNANLVEADAISLPFPDKTFDAIYLESVVGFQSPRKIRSYLGEIHRVIKDNRLCAVNELIWKDGIESRIVQEIVWESRSKFGLPPATSGGWALADWVREIEARGLEIVETLEISKIEDQSDHKELRTPAVPIRSRLFSFAHRLWSRISFGSNQSNFNFSNEDFFIRWGDSLLEARLFILVSR